MTTRLNQSLYVDGDIDLTGDINVPGNIYLGGFIFDSPTLDSLDKCEVTFTNVTDNRSNRMENVEFVENFKNNDWIRIYGAMTDSPTYSTGLLTSTQTTVVLNSPPTDLDDDFNITQFSYRFAEFDMTNGAIAPATNITSVNVKFPITQFSADRFVRITFQTIPETNRGLLVYRRVGISGQFKLAFVLGPKDFSQSFIDYYDFDYTQWSGKNETDNTYTSNTIHFPLAPPTTSLFGWCDEQIDFVDVGARSIVLKNQVRLGTNLTLNISHNDTFFLQDLIDLQETIGRKNLRLRDKVYVVSSLSLPSRFSLSGIPSYSTIKKLPWFGLNNNIIKTKDDGDATRITLDGIDIDGNLSNQYLLSDGSNPSANYSVNFGSDSENCVLNNTRIYNSIGGGLYAPSSNRLKINVSEIFNSGVTDRYAFSPVIADESTDIIISASRFENFTESLDVSLSYKGTVSNNIIQNCGTGLYIFGCRFFISSPNVLMGPAGEYLPLPDILNTEYNSVNITLVPDSPTPSPVFTYQENGELFNLISHPKNNIIYQVWKLEKTQLGQENLYGEITDVVIQDLSGFDKSLGQFSFIITRDDVLKLSSIYSYNTLVQQNPNHRAIVYTASLEEWVNAGTIVPTGSGESAVSGIVNGDEYTVSVQNIKYLYVGAEVELQNHSGFNLVNSNGIGEVSNISTVGQLSLVTIKFDGATITAGDNPLSLGNINIINKFLLAKGQII
jgi:hypothetical protein